MEENKNTRRKLTDGNCDCGDVAQIPWKSYKFCYRCWRKFWFELTIAKGVYNEPVNTQNSETREEAIQSSIKLKEKNGIRRSGSWYVNFNL